MNLAVKIKEIQIGKKRFFRIVLVVELCLLSLGVIGLFGKNKEYCFGEQAMTVNFGNYSEETGAVYVDTSTGQIGNAVDFNYISLPKGVYQVSLLYDTDTYLKNKCIVTDDTSAYKTLLSNGELLYSGLDRTDFSMWLLTNKEQLSVHAFFGGEGTMTVKGLVITETNALARLWIFWIIMGSLLVNCGVVYVQYDKTYGISVKDKNVAYGIALIILFSSLPLMMKGIVGSGDVLYHQMRIEGIKDGILAGQFPVRIAPEWQQGYGYASSIFYGETLLYVAACLRLIGFTVVDSYRIFMFLVNVATVFLSYFCFYRIFRDKYIGLLCSMVYTCSIYRIFTTYVRGALGEAFGVLFLPLLVYGYYRIFTQDVEAASYKRAWVPLTVALTGLIQSHLLTCEQVGIFTILLCIILWKKVFRPKTFMALAKTVIYTCLLSAWFLVPFLDYMINGDFVIKHVSGRTIQHRGIYLGHLLFTYFQGGSQAEFSKTGMASSQPMGIGIVFIIALTVWMGLLFFRKTAGMDKTEKVLGKITAGFGILAMLMSLSVFPWDKIQSLGAVTATLVSSIQFPNRFLTIATVCLTVVLGIVSKWVLQIRGVGEFGTFFAGSVVLVLMGSIYLTDSVLYSISGMQLYNEEEMGTGYIAGAEYLPYGSEPSLFLHRNPIVEGTVEIEDYTKEGLSIEVKCHNNGDTEGTMDMPLLYYKGYRAWDVLTGEMLPISMGANCVVGVTVPPGYDGVIHIAFLSPWYWRVAEILSLAVFVVLCMVCFWEKRKEKCTMLSKYVEGEQ